MKKCSMKGLRYHTLKKDILVCVLLDIIEASPACLNVTLIRTHINKWDVNTIIYTDKSAFRVFKHF